jgi:hypothetical protein
MHTFKNVLVYLMAPRKNNFELILKVKLELYLFQQYFNPPNPSQKKGETKTTFGRDSSQAH